jgi:hypothetical protein
MKTEMRHDESWTITVEPDEDETWPLARPYTHARDYRPTRITISLARRGDGSITQHISLSGHSLRKDGSAGVRRVSHGVFSPLPAWLADLVAKARAEHGMDSK